MAETQQDKSETQSPLVRVFSKIAGAGASGLLIKVLLVICILLGLTDVFHLYHKHPYVAAEELPNFYGFFGFIILVTVAMVASIVQMIVSRPEDYYGDESTDAEGFPETQLEKVKHND